MLAQAVDQKIIISGSFVEHYKYEKPFWLGLPQIRSNRSKALKKIIRDCRGVRSDNVRRARHSIRRLIDANQNLDKFALLTFNTEVYDLQSAALYWKKFVNRVLYYFPDFLYICVPEFQPKSGRVHYHFVCNLPYIDLDVLEKIWGQGFVGISYIKEREKVGWYVADYLGEDFQDERYRGKKKFFCSQALVRPVVMYGSDCEEYLAQSMFFTLLVVLHSSDYECLQLGAVHCDRFKVVDMHIPISTMIFKGFQ